MLVFSVWVFAVDFALQFFKITIYADKEEIVHNFLRNWYWYSNETFYQKTVLLPQCYPGVENWDKMRLWMCLPHWAAPAVAGLVLTWFPSCGAVSMNDMIELQAVVITIGRWTDHTVVGWKFKWQFCSSSWILYTHSDELYIYKQWWWYLNWEVKTTEFWMERWLFCFVALREY